MDDYQKLIQEILDSKKMTDAEKKKAIAELQAQKDSKPFLVLEKAKSYGCYWRNGKWNWKKTGFNRRKQT